MDLETMALIIYEKQKRLEALELKFNNIKPSGELLKLREDVQKETAELLNLQNAKTVISLDLPEYESNKDYEETMDKISDSILAEEWTKKDTNIIKQYEDDKKLGLKSKIGLFSTKLKKPTKSEKQVKPTKSISIDAKVHQTIKTDLVILGLRLVIGITFIVHGLMKIYSITIPSGINTGEFVNMLASFGIPIELAIPIALAELLSGIFLSIGFLSRISSVMIGIIMLGAIFVVKGAQIFVGPNGIELDIIILTCTSLLATFGPGRISVSNISIKGMIFTRFLH